MFEWDNVRNNYTEDGMPRQLGAPIKKGDVKMEEIKEYEPLKQENYISKVFAESGMFPDIKSHAQALVKILAGKELGLTPFEAMASIYIVGGKLALTSKAMASLIKKSQKYDYQIKTLTETECEIQFLRKSKEVNKEHGDMERIGDSIFTFKDAAKAGLVNKDNWKNYPKNMLFARALSNGARWYCPDVISGYYATEELEDVVDQPLKHTIELTADGEVKNG